MRNNITICKTPINGVQSTSKSAFMAENEGNVLDPFSFSDVTDIFKRKEKSSSSENTSSGNTPGSGGGILTGVLGVLGGLAPILPAIGIGSKSRIAETNAIAAGNELVYKAQAQAIIEQEKRDKEKQKIYILAGVGVLVIVVIIGVLFTKK